MGTNVALAKVCALPSARSSLFIGLYVCTYVCTVCIYVCYQLFSKITGPNCMRFSGMISNHPRTNRLDFGSGQVEGKGPGHEKVKNVFLS